MKAALKVAEQERKARSDEAAKQKAEEDAARICAGFDAERTRLARRYSVIPLTTKLEN
jgi:hypothetical protein